MLYNEIKRITWWGEIGAKTGLLFCCHCPFFEYCKISPTKSNKFVRPGENCNICSLVKFVLLFCSLKIALWLQDQIYISSYDQKKFVILSRTHVCCVPVPPVSIHHWSDLHRQHVRKSLVISPVRICKKDICGQIQKAHTNIEVPVHLEVKREFALLCKYVVPFHLEWISLNF